MRTLLAATILLAAAAPLAAQNAPTHQYDAGSFVVELPRGIPRLTFLGGRPDSDAFIGVTASGDVMVMVMRTRAPLPAMTNDTAATMRGAPAHSQTDTTLARRRCYLESSRPLFPQAISWLMLDARASEILTDARVALRSPITVRPGGSPPMTGTADVLVPRQGALEVWLVGYLAQTQAPEHDAAAQRMLDSFRVTGATRRDSIPAMQPGEQQPGS